MRIADNVITTFPASARHVNLAGMVRLRIKEVAVRRGIKTAYGLQKAMNVPPGTAARLWRGQMAMIGLQTIETLCEALGCEPGDLIVRENAAKASARKAKAAGGGRRGVA